MMPIKDGFSTASDIRGIDKEVPIIFLTAKSMKEDTLKGFELGEMIILPNHLIWKNW